MLCAVPSRAISSIYPGISECVVEFFHFHARWAVASEPVRVQQPIRFSEGFELDLRPRRLRRGRHVLKLERIPLEILFLLVEREGKIVTRDEIVSRVWGEGVFLDTDNSIRGAIRKLRQALKDDAESPRFIQTVTGLGYRFIAPVALSDNENPSGASKAISTTRPILESEPDVFSQRQRPSPEEVTQDQAVEETTISGNSRRHWQAHKWNYLVAAVLLAIAGIGTYNLARSHLTRPGSPKITSLAVLPLKNLSGDPAQDYFADGMTEEVIGRLAMIRGIRVISRTSVMQFKDTRLLAPEIAKTLRVDALVEGSVIREGNRIRVHAQLIRASTDEHFWSETYDRELGDALTLESEVAQAIARRVEVTVTGVEQARLTAARPVSPEVYEVYLKGLSTAGNSRADFETRIAYFDEAIQRDPTFAPAYVGLARGYDRLGTILVGAVRPSETRPKVIRLAQKALELDPDLPEAHLLLGETYMSLWRWSEAEAEFRRAFDLNPNDPAASDGLNEWLLCHGRIDEALVWARRRQELDPLGRSDEVGWTLFAAHRYDEAIHELRIDLAARPDDGGILWTLGVGLICNHEVDEAIPVLERAVSVTQGSPGVTGMLIWAYAHAGRRADALRLLEQLKKRQQTGYVPAAAFVSAYVGLGDKGEAFAWFERAYQEKSSIMKFLKVFPPYDSLRGDPRFQDLIRRVGLN
ncbi:tetratricopeptide repeat protein [Acidobacteria bacterium AB60]|nr:tetratricopeptide repeat protein [Acidobacteria bacterium AB60]